MLDLNEILALRPANATAATLTATLEVVAQRRLQVTDHAAALSDKLPAMLLQAPEKDIEAAEREIARSHRAIARLDALAGELREQRVQQARAETIARATAAREDIAARSHHFVARWLKEYPKLARGIRELLLLEADIWTAYRAASNTERDAEEQLQGADLPPWFFPGVDLAHPAEQTAAWSLRMSRRMTLPNIHGIDDDNTAPAPFWSTGERTHA